MITAAGGRRFYLAMAVVIAGVVVYGFSFTYRENLLYPAYPRPLVLYVHVVVFSAWVILLIVQTALVQSRRLDLHRRLGQWGVVHGVAIPVVGLATAVAMTRLRYSKGEAEAPGSFLIPAFDMIVFSAAFFLAVRWRRQPERHRRLMLVASCTLTAAAFGRMPPLTQGEWFYAGVDGLVLLGAARDRIVEGTVHPVYRIALPALVAGQLLLSLVRWSDPWLELAPRLFG